MSRTRTLSDLRTEIRERADVDSNYVGDAQLNRLINARLARVYRLLVSRNKDLYVQSDDLAVVSGTASYAPTGDFWRVLGVDVLDGSDWRALQRFNFADRNRMQTTVTRLNTRYRVVNGEVRLAPTPNWSGTVRVWYIPTAPTLVDAPATPNTWEGWAGYEELAVVEAVIQLKSMQEEDTSAEQVERKALLADVFEACSDHDDANPDQVRDVDAEMAAEVYGYLYGDT